MFVLVPGAGGSAWYWHPVEAELRRRGHDVVAVDLPGDDTTAGLPEYVDLVVDAAGGRSGVVMVGQSMGAFTATMACARVPVALLVLVNPMIPALGETPGAWWGNVGLDEARRANDVAAGRDPDAGFDLQTYFLHDVPPALAAEGGSSQRDEAEAAFASPCTFIAWPDVPTRVVIGRDDRFFPLEFQRRVARERVGVEIDEVPGGHLAALSHPVEVAAQLEAVALPG